MEAWLSCVACWIRALCEWAGSRSTSGLPSSLRRAVGGLWRPYLLPQPAFAVVPGTHLRRANLPTPRSATWLALFPGGWDRPTLPDALRSAYGVSVTRRPTVAGRFSFISPAGFLQACRRLQG